MPAAAAAGKDIRPPDFAARTYHILAPRGRAPLGFVVQGGFDGLPNCLARSISNLQYTTLYNGSARDERNRCIPRCQCSRELRKCEHSAPPSVVETMAIRGKMRIDRR